jgi:AraC-like DNA-binding protein
MKRSPIPPERAEAARLRQAAFFARTGRAEPLRALFDYLPQHRFFIKSASGHFLAANALNLRQLGFASEADLLGSTDEHAHSASVARKCRQDDMRIMRTQRPLINHLEMLSPSDHSNWQWGCTTKIAMKADNESVIGIMGVSYLAPTPASEVDEGVAMIGRLVAEIKKNHRQSLKVNDLARNVGMTPKRLNEHFQQNYRMSTQQFIIHERVQASVQTLLRTRTPLWEVALEHGFSDQSAFTRQFRQIMGQTPKEFRIARKGREDVRVADFIKNASDAIHKPLTILTQD